MSLGILDWYCLSLFIVDNQVASAGDIIKRATPNDIEAVPNFDYNTGKFELKPIAQKAEDLFTMLNDLYFYELDVSNDAATQQLTKAKLLFSEWTSLLD